MSKTKKKEVYDFLVLQRDREKQLLSNVLKCFEDHKNNTLEDLKILKHNLEVKP